MPRRRADMVFPGPRVAVFVDGCFWHSCPDHATIPRANNEWWVEKLRKNAARDRETNDHLTSIGWEPLRFWEHQPATDIVDVIEKFVRDRSPNASS
jgi:DNA mismatch endonuclease (patch repair protein)